jgi:hypothetical protein
VLSDLFRTIGLPSLAVCVPVGVVCAPGTSPLPTIPASGLPASTTAASTAPSAAAVPTAAAASPVGALADLLASPTGPRSTRASELAAGIEGFPVPTGRARHRTWLESVGRAIAEVLP